MNGADVVRYFSEDEQMKFLGLEREKALRDYISSQEYYRENGLAEGRAEGRAEGLAEGEAKGIIQTYNELGKSFSDTVARIALMYNISEKDAKEKVEQYWH